MSTILTASPSAAPLHQAELAREEETMPSVALQVPPVRSMAARFQRPSARRLIVCLAASLALHGVAMAGLAYVRQTTSWNWIPVQSGRASIDLQASIASTPSQGDPVLEAIPLPIPAEPQKETMEEEPAELADATATDVQRRAEAALPLPIRSPSRQTEPLLLAEIQVSVESDRAEIPSKRALSREPVTESSSSAHPMRRANVGLRYANELTDQLAESLPSTASQASRGAESQAPELVFNPAPQYPAEALAARLTGRVIVRVALAANGSVAEASVHQSSGSTLLDDAAVTAVRSWRFAPSEHGTAPRRLAVPVNFVIQDGS